MLQPSTTRTVHIGQSPDPTDGWALVTAAQQGNRDPFGQLYQPYPGRLSAHHGGKQ
jgi:hypothetical protein